VPFFVAGGGVPAGLDLGSKMVNNVDIGPTVLDLAGLSGGGYATDGTSFAPLLRGGGGGAAWRDRLVFEYWGLGYTERGPCNNGTSPCPGGAQSLEDAPSNSWSGLRVVNATHNIVYAEFRPNSNTPLLRANTNFTYAFNMTEDPYQLVNKAAQKGPSPWPPAFLQQLSNELWAVATCAGASCP
jgi:N-acetylglucosamine-6-sulfatase